MDSTKKWNLDIIIISENLGDYTNFVKQYNCGFVFNQSLILENQCLNKKVSNQLLAYRYFSKQSFKQQYIQLLNL